MFDSTLIFVSAPLASSVFFRLSDAVFCAWKLHALPLSCDEVIGQRTVDGIARNKNPGSGATAPGLNTYLEVHSVDGCEDSARLRMLQGEIPKLVEVRADDLVGNPEGQVAEAEKARRGARSCRGPS